MWLKSEEFGVANRDLKYPIEFEVNGLNLAEVQNCETATLLQHQCNGAPFVVDLAFTGPIEGMCLGSYIAFSLARLFSLTLK